MSPMFLFLTGSSTKPKPSGSARLKMAARPSLAVERLDGVEVRGIAQARLVSSRTSRLDRRA